jgi:hypothetical protein
LVKVDGWLFNISLFIDLSHFGGMDLLPALRSSATQANSNRWPVVIWNPVYWGSAVTGEIERFEI